ncbi:MAG: cysteine desulfurase [Methanospirillum sp.]|uniref:aminotransferase class V-fold PLP-dependent enzyme n=1 Tax=Methanospirillum sp. TaxID=45200 RepID=UPI00236F4046|nr:cysteine desulfurase [Methanospirillum sp.]MDD1729643.1 cysteine desulfurase [Methanospirillum sp.]
MDIEQIRQDIPLTDEFIYLDNASTSLSPRQVLDAMYEYETHYRANVGRGVHRLSQITGQLYWDAHETVNSFINGKDGTPVFVRNCTEAINMVARGLTFETGDEIITTVSDHHSNLLPWFTLRKQGVRVNVIAPSEDPAHASVTAEDVSDAIHHNTRLVAISQASNVLGTISPVREISAVAHESGALCLVDGAQSVPHMKTDVKEMGCDFLCFSGHKMLGPTGTGVLWMQDESIEPLLVGGGMIEEVTIDGYSPASGYQKYEAGTPHIAGALGLRAAITYLNQIGVEEIERHEALLAGELIKGLSDIEEVSIIGPPAGKNRIGVVSFMVEGMHPHDIAHLLDDQYSVMVRSGNHCCMPLMQHLGLKDGTVRASLYLYNTQEEIQTLISGVREIIEGI